MMTVSAEKRSQQQAAAEQVYPSPTLVIGVGNLGLAVLERLGEDWEGLRRAGGDATLGNLRLLHIATGPAPPASWRGLERQTTRLARQAGESDLPSLAVNLMILRSLGLVRFRDGTYQVALPRDGGVVGAPHLPVAGGEGRAAECEGVDEVPLRRRRYFDWLSLSPDPVTAVERLYRHGERTSELDLFMTPIINRVRQGHSPRALLACIGRCHALASGRDPSPWSWVKGLAQRQGQETSKQIPEPLALRFTAADPRAMEWLGLRPWDVCPVSQHAAVGLLDGYAPSPVGGWRKWLEARNRGGEGAAVAEIGLHIPAPFVPFAADVDLWLDPLELLRVDWETTGWATGEGAGDEPVEFEPVEASPFRLGLFDHDATGCFEGELGGPFARRLEALADLTRRGLVRLWIDLQRDRVEENSAQQWLEDRRRESADEALRQSLEILGELLVRPLAEEEVESGGVRADDLADEHSGKDGAAEGRVDRPSRLLSQYEFDRRTGRGVLDVLNRRLAALGWTAAHGAEESLPLLRTVELGPGDVTSGDTHLGDSFTPVSTASSTAAATPASGFATLAWTLNQQVRDLLEIEFLGSYRNRPLRRSPRLTIYLVGDMGEPFVRATLRTTLREIHAELLRSFSPIFEHFREGFDRSLSIVPILWMPHPADPFAGRPSERRREEESAIIDAIQGVRRWVESVIPASRRRVSQIFVNSKLTDTAVLNQRDAVRQTRDFITLQARSDLGADEWLRRTAVGPVGDDVFSSFACYEIEFPAEKARQYLANRLGRELLAGLRDGRGDEAVRVDTRALEPPPVEDLLRGLGRRLAGRTAVAATALAERVEGRAAVRPETAARDIAARFDGAFGRELAREVQRIWRHLVERRGEMDASVDGLRRRMSRLLGDTLGGVREQGDRWIEELAGRLGLATVHSAFTESRLAAREILERSEERRRRQEARCAVHRVPQTSALQTARLQVVEAAEGKADLDPMRWGFVLWLFLAPVLGAPLYRGASWLLAAWGGAPGRWLAPYLPWLVGLAVAAVAAWFLGGVMERSLARIDVAVEALARRCRELVEGPGDGQGDGNGDRERDGDGASTQPSVRSFFEARLRLTGALAVRSFALQVCDQATSDCRRAERLGQSVETQIHLLERRAEGLGVRPVLSDEGGERIDLLFSSHSGQEVETLIAPASLTACFERRWGHGGEQGTLVPALLAAAGGFTDWRQRAPLAESELILAFCRRQFGALVDRRLSRQHPLAEEAGQRLREFVARHFPNIGFGARFLGSEGLDPDGMQVLAEAALVLSGELRDLFLRASTADGPLTTRTLQIVPCGVRPNAAYMLSLAQGLRPHTVRNLRRFESFHDRTTLPEDRTFPLSGDGGAQDSLNHLSGYRSLARNLHRRFADGPAGEGGGEP